MNWLTRRTKNGIVWDDGRFTIQWSSADAAWTMYDREEKVHHRSQGSLGICMDLAERLVCKKNRIGLVACCKTKLAHKTVAERLYCSDLFQKAANYCRANYDRWFILSAKHGLVSPVQVIEPYEVTLIGQSVQSKKAWAKMVARQLESRGLLGKGVEFCLHAGKDYSEHLLPFLKDCQVSMPMKSLGIGEQLKFYKDALAVRE